MTLHEKRAGGLTNAPGAMLVYDTAGCKGGEGFNEMLLHLGCCMLLYDTA